MSLQTIKVLLEEKFSQLIQQIIFANDELTIEISPEKIHEVCLILRDDPELDFKMLIDVCGVDYLQYGIDEWQTESTTATGFERGVQTQPRVISSKPSRFAAVYHLLSLKKKSSHPCAFISR